MYPDFYFVRHAESLHNERATLVRKNLGYTEKDDISKVPEYLEVKYSPDYFDAAITEGGYKECLSSKKECENLDIGLVLVSPLQRALITCHETFKEHKNKPPVIVQPLLGQRMTSACDIGAKVRESMKMFPDYNYDAITSRGLEDTWYIENLPAVRKAELLEVMKQNNPQNAKDIGKVTLDLMKKYGNLESIKDVSVRVQKIKEKLLTYLAMTKKKIAIVGHSGMIKALTATGFNEDGSPINGVGLQNCEVKLVNLVMDGIVTDSSKKVFCG